MFTSVAKNNQKYLNWNDTFVINLVENEGLIKFMINIINYLEPLNVFYDFKVKRHILYLNKELKFECWDYNSENVERETDLLATGTLNIKQINFD